MKVLYWCPLPLCSVSAVPEQYPAEVLLPAPTFRNKAKGRRMFISVLFIHSERVGVTTTWWLLKFQHIPSIQQ